MPISKYLASAALTLAFISPGFAQYGESPVYGSQQVQYTPAPTVERESKVSLFMGADLGYNMTWQSYDEDSDYGDGEGRIVQSSEFEGSGFFGEFSLGVLIKDIIGARGFVNIGSQSGESSYDGKDIDCDSTCKGVSTDVTDVRFGIKGTFFPLNGSDSPMYNSYIEVSFGVGLHYYDDAWASSVDHEFAGPMFFKFEVGKLFPIGKTWNVGVGVAWSMDIEGQWESSNTQDISKSDIANTVWFGVKFARKKNKF